MNVTEYQFHSTHPPLRQRVSPYSRDEEGGSRQNLPQPSRVVAGSRPQELQSWLTSKLRPFLSIEGTRDTAELLSILERLTRECVGFQKVAVFAAVLDGSFEYCVEAFRRHHNNCVSPETVAESKDSLFFEIVANEVRLHGGRLLGTSSEEKGNCRLFQDGAVAVFVSDVRSSATEKALLASMNLHRKFGIRNEETCCDWRERIHSRCVVADNWNEAVRNLRLINREETFIASAWAKEVPSNILSLLFAAGVRMGVSPEDLTGTVEAQIRSVLKAGGTFK